MRRQGEIIIEETYHQTNSRIPARELGWNSSTPPTLGIDAGYFTSFNLLTFEMLQKLYFPTIHQRGEWVRTLRERSSKSSHRAGQILFSTGDNCKIIVWKRFDYRITNLEQISVSLFKRIERRQHSTTVTNYSGLLNSWRHLSDTFYHRNKKLQRSRKLTTTAF